MYEIRFSQKYEKKISMFFMRHSELKSRYIKIIRILQINPSHPSLRLHKLKGKKSEFYSISLDMSYRVILDFIIQDKIITLVDIGSHDEVYS